MIKFIKKKKKKKIEKYKKTSTKQYIAPYSLQKPLTLPSSFYETVFEKFLGTWSLQSIKKKIIITL